MVAVSALIAAGWAAVGLRLARSPLWVTGGIVAAGLAGALVMVAAFLPLVVPVGALAVPLLAAGGGILLMAVFARPHGVAAALTVPLALFVLLQPQWFPLALPLILVTPMWTVGWLEREGDAGRYVLVLLATMIAVPVLVFGVFFALRGPR
ncbi:MAG TPA: hypothetical protein VFW12_10690 [Candidatus Limnocylindria bacterium]|nr:hypothetical protein [Candidatus Limnocylindria bacterium]